MSGQCKVLGCSGVGEARVSEGVGCGALGFGQGLWGYGVRVGGWS